MTVIVDREAKVIKKKRHDSIITVYTFGKYFGFFLFFQQLGFIELFLKLVHKDYSLHFSRTLIHYAYAYSGAFWYSILDSKGFHNFQYKNKAQSIYSINDIFILIIIEYINPGF